ncbi:epsin-1-like [Sycon ciliatum]|uniref:epsin-1-like n=1 Tax=Sycon ciliatum TaxID=27933 RepID=UPI0031F6B8E1
MNVRRHIKHKVGQFTPIQVKVRDATSNDPWGPPTALLADISDAAQNPDILDEIFQIIWKRLGDDGKNWRHVFKSLVLVEYLIKTGPLSIMEMCSAQAYCINTLKNFQFEDKDGKDHGANVRDKAKQISALLKDPDLMREQRNSALQVKRTFSEKDHSPHTRDYCSPEPSKIGRSASITALSGQEKNLDTQLHGSSGGRPRAANQWEAEAQRQTAALQINTHGEKLSASEIEERLAEKAKALSLITSGMSVSEPAIRTQAASADPWGVPTNAAAATTAKSTATRPTSSSQTDAWGSAKPAKPAAPAHNDPWASPQAAMDAFGCPTFSAAAPVTPGSKAVPGQQEDEDAFGSPAFGSPAMTRHTRSQHDLPAQGFSFQENQLSPAGSQSSVAHPPLSHTASAPSARQFAPQQPVVQGMPSPLATGPQAFAGMSGQFPADQQAAQQQMQQQQPVEYSPSPSPVDTKPAFLDDHDCALVNLDNLLTAKERPVTPKQPNSLNHIRTSQSSPTPGNLGNAASADGTILPSPLIPAPDSNQPRVQPGRTWSSTNMAPTNSMGMGGMAPANMAMGGMAPANMAMGGMAPVNMAMGGMAPGNMAMGGMAPVGMAQVAMVPTGIPPVAVASAGMGVVPVSSVGSMGGGGMQYAGMMPPTGMPPLSAATSMPMQQQHHQQQQAPMYAGHQQQQQQFMQQSAGNNPFFR